MKNPERTAAKIAGFKFYLPARPCRNGHICLRRTSTNHCCECVSEWNSANHNILLRSSRKWRENNPDKQRLATAAWAAAHPEEKREKDRKWHIRNQERNNARSRQWQRDNYDRRAPRQKQWKSENREKVNAYSRNRSAIKKGASGKHTASDIIEIRKAQRNKCAYCMVDLGKVEVHVDHIIPLKMGGSNSRSNLQLLCETCNLSKGFSHPVEYARRIGRLI